MQKKKSSQYVGKFLEKDYNTFKDGILELLDDYKRKSERLDKIIKQSDRIQLKLLKANEELDEYKNSLEKKVEEEIKKREEKESLLLKQSKAAAMGEMIDAVAHQWSQPLNLLSLQNQSLLLDFENGDVDEKYIREFQKDMATTIEHMTNTLNEFRTFFDPNKEFKEFSIEKMLRNTSMFVKNEFMKEKIQIDIQLENDFNIFGIENEFKHIILNILNNSKDAFNSNNIKERTICIKANKKEECTSIIINDNAGGIPEDIIDNIFKAHITTKGKEGSGAGLYMSTLIAEKYNMSLSALNVENGASFILETK